MKGPMPSVPSLREKAVWCKAFTRKHGRATPELSVQSRAYLRRQRRHKAAVLLYYILAALQTGWYHGSITAFVPVLGRGL